MSDVLHTPEPWTLMEVNGGRDLWVVHEWEEDEKSGIDEICQLQMDYPPGVAEANGLLIAAAPEMVELLRQSVRAMRAAAESTELTDDPANLPSEVLNDLWETITSAEDLLGEDVSCPAI